MNEINQLSLIEKFLISNNENIIINQVNDDIGLFYINVIKHYAEKKGIKVSINQNSEYTETEGDLFGLKVIEILNITNEKKLTETINTQNKKIILTNYKNYKKLHKKYTCINGYKFGFDIDFFIKHELGINNNDLLFFCKNNPSFIISETSKYLINKDQYVTGQALVEEKNNVLVIRKSIFEIKKNNFNIKDLYLSLKKEAEYKKLSFLTY